MLLKYDVAFLVVVVFRFFTILSLLFSEGGFRNRTFLRDERISLMPNPNQEGLGFSARVSFA